MKKKKGFLAILLCICMLIFVGCGEGGLKSKNVEQSILAGIFPPFPYVLKTSTRVFCNKISVGTAPRQ